MTVYALFIGFALLVCLLGCVWSLPELLAWIDDRIETNLAEERDDWKDHA